ncbi:MAG: PAS domain S-box protein [Actinomycetota bacterium]
MARDEANDINAVNAPAVQWTDDLVRRVIETSLDAIVVVDGRGAIAFANQQTAKMFGYNDEELLGASVEMLVPERLRSRHRPHREGYGEKPQPRPMGIGLDLFARRKDGSEFPVEISLAPFDSPAGPLVSANIRDISHQRALEAMNSRLAAIVESSSDAIIGTNRQRIITAWNAGAERVYGHPASDALGRSIALLVSPEKSDECPAIFDAAFDGTTTEGFETQRLRRDGRQIDVSLTVSPIVDRRTGVVTGASIIARDITEKKAAEQALSVFIANAAHELRTPLTTLAGFADVLAIHRHTMNEEQMEQAFEVVRRQGARARELIDNLLDLSRIDAGSPSVTLQSVALRAAIEHAVDLAIPPDGVRVRTEVPEGINVIADPLRLDQIVINLLTNAYRYGGPNVTLTASSSHGTAVLRVADDGPGVPEELVPRLFDPFARGGDVAGTPGSGLGLAIVRRLVDAFGGEIRHEHNSPTGAIFALRLKVQS